MSQNNVTLRLEEVQEWLSLPVTKVLFNMLNDWREELRDRLEDGVHLVDADSRFVQAQFVGSLATIKQLQGMDAEVLLGVGAA